MTTQKNSIKPKSLKIGPIDLRDKKLERFWERIEKSTPKKEIPELSKKVIKLIREAKETILIYSPVATLPEMKIELEKASESGVRIYAITTNVKNHQSLFPHGIMREKNFMNSSFLVVDPTSKAKGIWFPGLLKSKSKPRMIIELTEQQAKEAWAHFSHLFWQASGQELFFKKLRQIPKLDEKAPEIPTTLNSTMRDEDFSKLDGCEIHHMSVPSSLPSGFDYYLMAKQLGVRLNEGARDVTTAIDTSSTQLIASDNPVTGYTKLSTGSDEWHFAFDWDFGVILNEKQVKEVEKCLPDYEWQYYHEKSIGDVKGAVILDTDNWDQKSSTAIKEKGTIELGDIPCDSIEEWQKEEKKPTIPDDLHLFRNVEFTYKLIPPLLPKGSQKHRLYKLWDKFDSDLKREVNKILKDITKAVSQEKLEMRKTKEITKKGEWKQFIKDLEKLRDQEWRFSRAIDDVKRGLNKIKEIHSRFLNEAKNIQVKGEIDKKSNELIAYLNIKVTETKIDIPHDTLPDIGTLYESGNRNHLLIESEEDLPKAFLITKRYKAKIVAPQGD